MRRMFWMTLGAAAGVGGYRKVTRFAHSLAPGRLGAGSGGYPRAGGSAHAGTSTAGAAGLAIRIARETAGFVRDVREGMRIYRLSGSRQAPTLERHRDIQDWAFMRAIADGECSDNVKDGQ